MYLLIGVVLAFRACTGVSAEEPPVELALDQMVDAHEQTLVCEELPILCQNQPQLVWAFQVQCTAEETSVFCTKQGSCYTLWQNYACAETTAIVIDYQHTTFRAPQLIQLPPFLKGIRYLREFHTHTR